MSNMHAQGPTQAGSPAPVTEPSPTRLHREDAGMVGKYDCMGSNPTSTT